MARPVGIRRRWADQTVPQAGSGRQIHAWPRGKVLGGSSGINGMIHLRAHQSSYDRWEAMGATGWDYQALLPFLRRSETAVGRDRRVRGSNGPMLIAPPADPDPLSRAWFEAAVERGHPVTDDGNGSITEGVSWTEMNVVDGRRQSAADAYLRPNLGRENLTIVTAAHVIRLVSTIAGVVAPITPSGTSYIGSWWIARWWCAREPSAPRICSCCRASGLPGTCTRSASTFSSTLGRRADLHDHLMCWIGYRAAAPLPPTNGVPHVLLHSSPERQPDLQIGFAPAVFGPRWSIRPEAGFSVTFALMSPASRGSVQISGPHPCDPLLIDPAYLDREEDMERMMIGFRRAREIGNADELTPWRGEALEPAFDTSDDDACRAYIRASAGPYFHPVGTCRIGTDGMAVVDPCLRVRGVEGLRIADASVMPTISLRQHQCHGAGDRREGRDAHLPR